MQIAHSIQVTIIMAFIFALTIDALSNHDQQSLDMAEHNTLSQENNFQLREELPTLLLSPSKKSVQQKLDLANEIVSDSIHRIDLKSYRQSTTGLDFLYNVFTKDQDVTSGSDTCDSVFTDVLVDYALERDQRYFLAQDIYLALITVLRIVPPQIDPVFSELQNALNETRTASKCSQ